MYFRAPLVDAESERNNHSRVRKVGIAFIGGICLALCASSSTVHSAIYQEGASTSLLTMPTSLRMQPMTIGSLPGAGPYKQAALAAMESSNRCEKDPSMHATRIKALTATMSGEDKALIARAEAAATANAQELLKAGQVAPLGFWDPVGLSVDVSEGRLLFLREAELKHGRVCMLAFLGMLVGEQYHPLFGGNVDVSAAGHFASFPNANSFWFAAYAQFIVASYVVETKFSRPSIYGQFIGQSDSPEVFAAKGGRIPGDLGFDPLGLKPKEAKSLLEVQNKELLNGRLAMIATIGVLAQEGFTGEKVFR